MSDGVLAAVRAFVARIHAFEPAAGSLGDLVVRFNGDEARMTITGPVARALAEALGAYQDPRDHGPCDACGGHRVDDNFHCLDCGHLNGLFGQLVAERAARYRAEPSPELEG
ncbi:hypothetical protein ACFQX7_34080 [Luedemannella flava]